MDQKERDKSRLKEEYDKQARLQHPEDYNPSFKPDTSVSQSKIPGRNGENVDKSFENFLDDINMWKLKKNRKMTELKEELMSKE